MNRTKNFQKQFTEAVQAEAYNELFRNFDKAWTEAKSLHEKINVWKIYSDTFDELRLMIGDPTAGKPMGLIK